MRVCVLGGGGNVAEAICGLLCARGHEVFQFRFPAQVPVPGVPIRPARTASRLEESHIEPIPGLDRELARFHTQWLEPDRFGSVDVFIFAFPSYMAEHVGMRLGPAIAGRPLINLSDRFLGTYSLIRTAVRLHGDAARPTTCVAFNGVPIMAQKAWRDGHLTVFFSKPRHSVACFPWTARAEALQLIEEVFGIEPGDIKWYHTMLHLAFENAHCVEHAVVDLDNLKAARYAPNKLLYSRELYRDAAISRIELVLRDRDALAEAVVGATFASLADYDARVFAASGAPDISLVGRAIFRIEHQLLRRAPAQDIWGAFGYEDIGWSMVTMESFAGLFGLRTPALSALINEWCEHAGADYRLYGRTCDTLGIAVVDPTERPCDYRALTWLPGFCSPRTAVDPPHGARDGLVSRDDPVNVGTGTQSGLHGGN